MNLLLVDDKPENLVTLEAVLKCPEYELITASSGKEAIEIVQKKDIDLILMDIQMPDMDGYEATKQIKKIEKCADALIIFITAVYTEDPFVTKGYEVGAIDYFSKPFNPDILKLKVQLYCSFRQKKRLLREREIRLKQSEELLMAGKKLKGVLDSLPVGIIIVDDKGKISQANEQISKICEAAKATPASSYGEYFEWWDGNGKLVTSKENPLKRALKGGQASRNELFPMKSFNGVRKTVLCSISPLHGLDNSIAGAVVVIQDVTERCRIEEDLEHRLERLVSASFELT